jgi:hypothetical protein
LRIVNHHWGKTGGNGDVSIVEQAPERWLPKALRRWTIGSGRSEFGESGLTLRYPVAPILANENDKR